MINFLCFHTQWEVFFQINFHPAMKFYSFHPEMKLTCKQNFFHPRISFIPGWDFISITCKRTLSDIDLILDDPKSDGQNLDALYGISQEEISVVYLREQNEDDNDRECEMGHGAFDAICEIQDEFDDKYHEKHLLFHNLHSLLMYGHDFVFLMFVIVCITFNPLRATLNQTNNQWRIYTSWFILRTTTNFFLNNRGCIYRSKKVLASN